MDLQVVWDIITIRPVFFFTDFVSLPNRQRAELEDLRKQLEDNSSLTGKALREELEKSREEQERRHQVAFEQTFRNLQR